MEIDEWTPCAESYAELLLCQVLYFIKPTTGVKAIMQLADLDECMSQLEEEFYKACESNVRQIPKIE
jgi:hypothetical protein